MSTSSEGLYGIDAARARKAAILWNRNHNAEIFLYEVSSGSTRQLSAELQTRIYHESQKRPTYSVPETLGL